MAYTRGFNGSVNISENCDFRTLLHNFIAFYLKYFFVAIYILNEKVQNKQICKSKDGWVIDENTFDFK